MAYAYVCDSCLREDHENCEKGDPLVQILDDFDPELCGGGVCICSHQPLDEVNSDFELGFRE